MGEESTQPGYVLRQAAGTVLQQFGLDPEAVEAFIESTKPLLRAGQRATQRRRRKPLNPVERERENFFSGSNLFSDDD